jgi:hypothetical protein
MQTKLWDFLLNTAGRTESYCAQYETAVSIYIVNFKGIGINMHVFMQLHLLPPEPYELFFLGPNFQTTSNYTSL